MTRSQWAAFRALYPEGLNDSTKATALKAAWRRVIVRVEAEA